MEIIHKKKLLFDDSNIEEKSSVKDTVVNNHDTGEVIFEGSNKVLFPGAEMSAMNHFDISAESAVQTYSDIMNIDTDAASASVDVAGAKHKNYLFCIGTDGCGPEASQKYPVSFIKPMLPADLVDDPTLGYMIPFRYLNTANPLDRDSTFRSKYFGRRVCIILLRLMKHSALFSLSLQLQMMILEITLH